MALAPLLVGALALGALGVIDPAACVDALLLSILLFEVGLRAAQLRLWRMPFSRRSVRGDTASTARNTNGYAISECAISTSHGVPRRSYQPLS